MAINKRTKRKQVSGHKKTKWSKDGDQLLLNNIKKYLKKHTDIDWTKVVISTRNSKQCQERYKNQLNPNINKSKFSENEINIIIEKQKIKEFKNKWKKISSFLDNRTEAQVKNCWHTHINKIDIYSNIDVSSPSEEDIFNDFSDLSDLEPDYNSNLFSQQVITNNDNYKIGDILNCFN